MIIKYARGMVYWCNLPRTLGEGTQAGMRPCIIISNDVGNAFSANVTVVPCTSKLEKATTQPTHKEVNVVSSQKSVALCENIVTVSKTLMTTFLGLLDPRTMEEIDECVKIALALTDAKEATLQIPKYEPPAVRNEPSCTVPVEKPRITTTTIAKYGSYLKTEAQKRRFIRDYEQFGLEYTKNKYHIASDAAVKNRVSNYKKVLTGK